MMKKVLCITLTLLLSVLLLTACNSGSQTDDTTADTVDTAVSTQAPETADATEPVTDATTEATTEVMTESATDAVTEAETEGAVELTNADYVKAYNAAIKKIFGETQSKPATTASVTPAVKPLSYSNVAEGEHQNYHAVGAFVFFLRNLYELETFERTEEAVHLTASYEMVIEGQSGGETLDAIMRNFRTRDGMLRSDLYQSVTEGDKVMQQYIQIDVDFDFEAEVLSAFDFTVLLLVNGEVFQFENFRYDGQSIQILDTEVQDDDYTAALSTARDRMTDIQGRVATAKDIGDFSKQYDDAMTEQFKIAYPDLDVQ